MDKLLNDLFGNVNFSANILNLMTMNVKQDTMGKNVLVQIAKHDPILQGDKGVNKSEGVTKETIRLSIYTKTVRGEKSNEKKYDDENEGNKVRLINPSIKVIDSAVSFLSGATLVYCDKVMKEKRWKLTVRGLEVVKKLIEDGEITQEEIFDY